MWALGIFCFNALVVIFSGWLLASVWPEISAGMILEVPCYQWPAFRALAGKVWLRLREFVVLSWPLLIAGSLVLGLGGYWHFDHYANAALSPLTLGLGPPVVLGTTLVFGVLRKELAPIIWWAQQDSNLRPTDYESAKRSSARHRTKAHRPA
jgi:ferrous iron transport protein B